VITTIYRKEYVETVATIKRFLSNHQRVVEYLFEDFPSLDQYTDDVVLEVEIHVYVINKSGYKMFNVSISRPLLNDPVSSVRVFRKSFRLTE